MEIIAIIPARGGSRRLPRKNVLPMAGRPLVAHTIGHAKGSALVDRVVVSTDDGEIASVSAGCGAEVIERPADLSSDGVASPPVLLHALRLLEGREGYRPDIVVLLQCTSPVRRRDDVDNAIKTFMGHDADCVFSACRFKDYVWRTGEGGLAESVNFDYRKEWWRGQDFPPQFRSNGSIFVYRRDAMTDAQGIFGERPAIYEMDYLSSFQVDTMDDFRLCEGMLGMVNGG